MRSRLVAGHRIRHNNAIRSRCSQTDIKFKDFVVPAFHLLTRNEPFGGQTYLSHILIEDLENTNDVLVRLCAEGQVPGPPGRAALPENHRLARLNLEPHQFYKRCARPPLVTGFIMGERPPGPLYLRTENGAVYPPHDAGALAASMNQLSILSDELQIVLETVEPNQDNMNYYGHAISNLLILASMNFENECKGVLRENGYAISARTNTTDYVKILPALRLSEYSVNFPFFPQIETRAPFLGWNDAAATRSLNWYDAYNAVKHNRHESLSRATLSQAINSIAACAIMIAAQYRSVEAWTDQIGGFFHFSGIAD